MAAAREDTRRIRRVRIQEMPPSARRMRPETTRPLPFSARLQSLIRPGLLGMTFMGAMIAAGLAVAAFGIIDAVVAARQNELAGQIGLARAAAVASRDAASGSLTAVRTTLAQRKQTVPS